MPLGSSVLVVSRLALGVMMVASGSSSDPASTVWKRGHPLVGRALDAGIIDVADMYSGGQSEQMQAKARGYAVIDPVQKIANRHNATVAQTALSWLLAKSRVASILLGLRKIAQLEDNLGAINVNLADEELATLDKLTAPANLSRPVPCRDSRRKDGRGTG